jgi:hypothetical protein
MYGVTGENRPIFVKSDAFAYSLGDPSYSSVDDVLQKSSDV